MFFKESSLLVGPVGLRVFMVGEAVKVGVNEMDGADVTGTGEKIGKEVMVRCNYKA